MDNEKAISLENLIHDKNQLLFRISLDPTDKDLILELTKVQDRINHWSEKEMETLEWENLEY